MCEMSDARTMRRLEVMVALNKALPSLASTRMGALLLRARPDLGRFFLEVTSPNVPSDAPAQLSDSTARLVAAEDNALQRIIDLLVKTQKWVEGETE
jgi:hypothetical protein